MTKEELRIKVLKVLEDEEFYDKDDEQSINQYTDPIKIDLILSKIDMEYWWINCEIKAHSINYFLNIKLDYKYISYFDYKKDGRKQGTDIIITQWISDSLYNDISTDDDLVDWLWDIEKYARIMWHDFEDNVINNNNK